MFAYIKEQKNNNKVEENEKDGEQTYIERSRVLYVEKAAGRVMQGVLPEGVAPNPTGARLGWEAGKGRSSDVPSFIILIDLLVVLKIRSSYWA